MSEVDDIISFKHLYIYVNFCLLIVASLELRLISKSRARRFHREFVNNYEHHHVHSERSQLTDFAHTTPFLFVFVCLPLAKSRNENEIFFFKIIHIIALFSLLKLN